MEKISFEFPNKTPTVFRMRQVHIIIILAMVFFFTLTIWPLHHTRKAGTSVVDHYKDTLSHIPFVSRPKPAKEARRLYPSELMTRPIATDLTRIPKLFHQSWSNATLPVKFLEWSNSCRRNHPEWEWVLWTDEDNLKLVERYAPWFLDSYDELGGEIYRADAARNIYMHVFGGVYADLDTECLRPYDTMFANYSAVTAPHLDLTNSSLSLNEAAHSGKDHKAIDELLEAKKLSHSSHQGSVHMKAERKAFLGRMGTEAAFGQSLPNAWMASTPGHPFWLLPLESVSKDIGSGLQPEDLTGPGALYNAHQEYEKIRESGETNGISELDQYYTKSGWRHLYRKYSTDAETLPPHFIQVLPFYEIYPFSWARDGDMFRDYCLLSEPAFNADKCKKILALDHWQTHSITYWGHSWSGSDGHWNEHMDIINRPNKAKPPPTGDTIKKESDATEANKKLLEEKLNGEQWWDEDVEGDNEKDQELDERSLCLATSPRRRRRRVLCR